MQQADDLRASQSAGRSTLGWVAAPGRDVQALISPAPSCTACPPQSFFLHPPIECTEGDVLACNIEVVRRKDNQRLMDVLVRHCVEGRPSSERTSAFHIE